MENQLVSNRQNLLLPCANTLDVQYTVANPIATLGFGESINAGEGPSKDATGFCLLYKRVC